MVTAKTQYNLTNAREYFEEPSLWVTTMMSEELCKRFAKRDTEIDAALAKLLAGHPELGGHFGIASATRHGETNAKAERHELG
jgi:hypothetical protein